MLRQKAEADAIIPDLQSEGAGHVEGQQHEKGTVEGQEESGVVFPPLM